MALPSSRDIAAREPPVTWMSLPNKPQLLVLALCRLSEPLSNTCLLPYLYYLIRSLQTDATSQASISRQAGLLVSLFALAQFATSVPWASFANHYGRKPTIIIGLVLSIVSNVGFGFSTTIPAVMCWRVLAGIGNGNIGVMRTMTAEIVLERKYQSRAFLLLPLVFNSGVVIGLALGGCLADPIVNIPWFFGPSGVFNLSNDPQGVAWMRAYPFALPTIFNAAALGGSLFLAVFGLKETMPGLEHRKDGGIIAGAAMSRIFSRVILRRRFSGYLALDDEDQIDREDDLMDMRSPLRVASPSQAPLLEVKALPSPRPRLSMTDPAIWTREVLFTIISCGLLPLHNSAFMQVFPVFLSTPPSEVPATSALTFNGGLGLPSPTIGLFLSAFGVFGILIQLCIYPSLQAWLGTLRSYRVALAMFPLAYLLAPYLCLIPNSHYVFQGGSIAFILFLQVTARTFGIPSSVILLTNSAPSPLALGAVHGVGNMLSSLSRALGPALGGVIFGWGMEQGVVGVVWWSYLLVVSAAGLAWSWMLQEGERPTMRPVRKEESIELASGSELNEKGGSARERGLGSKS
ncbi:hypothetical protein LZ554_008780 [Drepanopeziza brunnea f. sp. 'monogermtubi']|nr:hypothetical protein LZ554_008780 [Drepanopeziza brunnea f. sp. 'monogermtubi']